MKDIQHLRYYVGLIIPSDLFDPKNKEHRMVTHCWPTGTREKHYLWVCGDFATIKEANEYCRIMSPYLELLQFKKTPKPNKNIVNYKKQNGKERK